MGYLKICRLRFLNEILAFDASSSTPSKFSASSSLRKDVGGKIAQHPLKKKSIRKIAQQPFKKLNCPENYLIGQFNINEILKCHSPVP